MLGPEPQGRLAGRVYYLLKIWGGEGVRVAIFRLTS